VKTGGIAWQLFALFSLALLYLQRRLALVAILVWCVMRAFEAALQQHD
jgi:hypothetical protein